MILLTRISFVLESFQSLHRHIHNKHTKNLHNNKNFRLLGAIFSFYVIFTYAIYTYCIHYISLLAFDLVRWNSIKTYIRLKIVWWGETFKPVYLFTIPNLIFLNIMSEILNTTSIKYLLIKQNYIIYHIITSQQQVLYKKCIYLKVLIWINLFKNRRDGKVCLFRWYINYYLWDLW